MAENAKDSKAARQLMLAIDRVVSNSRIERCAGMGYAQACMAMAATQAIINLLKSKNIISDTEITNALAEEYEMRFKQLSGSQGAAVAPAPVVRPS